MIIMALDHTRDLVGLKVFNPTDLTKTTVIFFFTRWVTHFCAPGFMLLAGTGAYLSAKDKPALSRFLVSRGLWMMFAELTIINFAWTFAFTRPGLMVIWALGWSMVCLAALVWLPRSALAVVCVAIVALHNLFDGATVAPLVNATGEITGSASDWLVSLLHQQNGPVRYPLIPWVAVMGLGYVLGPVFQLEPVKRVRTLTLLGAGLVLAFIAVRGLNVYGDPVPWSSQPSPTFTVLSFLNVFKYPPSLDYLLVTLGPLLLLLAFAERVKGWLEALLVTFGRVPFFYYVLHLASLHALALVVALAQGFSLEPFFGSFFNFPKTFGLHLWAVYLCWGGVVAALYVPCRWFGALKARRRDWWLSYL
jgi:uncharacterized membrane protein